MEEAYLVLSALGPDRPGLVAQITQFIARHGGNVEDSRMAVLGGEFGVMILVSCTPDERDRIEQELPQLEDQTGLGILMRPTESPEEHRRAAVVPCSVIAAALDNEGLVHAVSNALYQTGVNIVSLQTTAYNAPVTGSPLFRLEATVDVPREVSVGKVRQAMERVGEEQGLDITVRSLHS